MDMIVILIIICITIAFILAIYLLLKTYKLLKNNGTNYLKVTFSVFLLIFLVFFIGIVSILTSYNYLCQRGTELIIQKERHLAIKPLERALYIRSKTGNLAKLLDNKVFGVPLLFYPENAVRMTLANNYYQLKDFDMAIEEYQKVLFVDSNNFEAISGIAESYFLMNDINKSKLFYQKLITTLPEEQNFDYYFEMGKAHIVLKNFKNAIDNFNVALKFGEKEDIIKRLIDECKKTMEKQGV